MLDFQFRNIVVKRQATRADKFMSGAGAGFVNDQCHRCAYWTKGTLACQAFPNGIPLGFLTAELDHTKPYPGDNGVRFKPVDNYL